MQKKYTRSLFIFRRDLRLHDNTALIQACKQSASVIPCFIFDEQQVTTHNSYRSMNAILFMIQSLQDLAEQINHQAGKLYLFYGNTDALVEKLIKDLALDALFVNEDYTPFSRERDKKLEEICTKKGIHFEQSFDLLLQNPQTIHSLKNTPYYIFTPFFKRASLMSVATPIPFKMHNFFTDNIKGASIPDLIFKKVLDGYTNKNLYTSGGSKQAEAIINKISAFKDYSATHDYPAIATTYLAAHLKFGTISIRHAYHTITNTLGTHHPLLRQLYWRDFFTHTAYHMPQMFGHSLKKKYEHLTWNNNTTLFKKWCEGQTGFPIVDAGMRQLNKTGFMHNRVRMITASFLVKDLHIDWQWGERYFAQQLTDYDPALNNGNWQWCASTGLDSQPYFRIFNPWLQQKKFDKECTYIKKWIPELAHLDPSTIHSWYKDNNPTIKNYPRPIIEHTQESTLTKMLYKKRAA